MNEPHRSAEKPVARIQKGKPEPETPEHREDSYLEWSQDPARRGAFAPGDPASGGGRKDGATKIQRGAAPVAPFLGNQAIARRIAAGLQPPSRQALRPFRGIL